MNPNPGPAGGVAGVGRKSSQLAVITDLLGSYPWFVPPFVKHEADLATAPREAAKAYVTRVTG